MIDLDFSNIGQSVMTLIMRLVIVLLALTVHETAHGYAALKLGDDTAEKRGRLSLNPIYHIDPIGFLCMVIFGFGWARPVPINAGRFKNPKRGMAISALAGPVSNLLLAFIGLLLYLIVYTVAIFNIGWMEKDFAFNLYKVTAEFLFMFHYMNISLAIFNFLPEPPLDGSRVLWAVLPEKIYFGVMKYERYISMAIMLLLLFGLLDKPLTMAAQAVSGGSLFPERLYTPRFSS